MLAQSGHCSNTNKTFVSAIERRQSNFKNRKAPSDTKDVESPKLPTSLALHRFFFASLQTISLLSDRITDCPILPQ
jgi:hypothetical protein